MKQNKVEKLLAGVLSISLAMGVSVMPAFAAQVQGPPYEDMSRVYLTKNYELANTGTISPEETFTFTIDPDTVTDASDGIKAADYMPSVGDVTYRQGEAGSANKTRQIEIQLPEYDSVGVYTYIIHEVAGDSAGVTYYGDAILLRVTVIEQDGKLRIAAVHTLSLIHIWNGCSPGGGLCAAERHFFALSPCFFGAGVVILFGSICKSENMRS